MKKIMIAVCLTLLTVTTVSAERLWENYSIGLASGNQIWATVDKNQDCFNLTVGSSGTPISGVASNCSGDVNGYWYISANGKDVASFKGGPDAVISEIVQLHN